MNIKIGDIVRWNTLSLSGIVIGFEDNFSKVLWHGSSEICMVKTSCLIKKSKK